MGKKIILPLALALLATVSSCSLKGKHYDVRNYMHDLTWKENFKILQLTDLHFSSYDDVNEDLEFMDAIVEKANHPDMIVVTGDLFTFVSKKTIRTVLNHINDWGIQWTLIYGNHDEQIYADYTYTSKYAAKLSNSIFSYYDDDLTGLSNNIYNLKDESNKTKFQIFALDSNTYTYKKGISYDYVHEDQIEWYKNAVETVNKDNDASWTKGSEDTVKSIIFQHIPVPEFTEIYNKYKSNSITYKGVAREDPCPPDYNSGFFDVIKDYGSTKAMIVGHDHINTLDAIEDGFEFVYGVKSTDNMYHDDDLLGGRIVTIEDEKTISTEEINLSYAEVK